MDWKGSTSYQTQFNSAVSTWNNYKSGVIRKDAWNTINDVTISDYNEVSSTAGVTSSAGTIKFNTYQMDNFTSAQKRNVCTHELGHALGLAHNAKGDVMYSLVRSQVKKVLFIKMLLRLKQTMERLVKFPAHTQIIL